MKRVLIVGCPGAGKSTAAREISQVTGLTLIHLDRHYWLPGWKKPKNDEWSKIVSELVSRPTWIIDGNYSNTLELRLTKADTLIHLDYPTWLCVWRVLFRTFNGLACNRDEEFASGCKERFNWEFLRYVILYRHETRKKDMDKMVGFSGQVYRFTSPSALATFIKALKIQNA